MGDATAGDDGGEDNADAAGEGQQSSNDSVPDSDSSTPGTDGGLGGAFTDASGDDDDDPPPQFGAPDGMLGVAPGRNGADTNPYTDNIEPPLDDGIYAMPPYFDLSPEEKAGPIPTTPLDIQPGPIPNPPANPDPLLGYPQFYQDILLPGLPPPPTPGPPPFGGIPPGLLALGLFTASWGVAIAVGYVVYNIANNPALGGWYGNSPGNFGLPPAGPPSPFALNQDYLEGNAA